MSKAYCPDCKSAMLLGAKRCTCGWQKFTEPQPAHLSGCEFCGKRARTVFIGDDEDRGKKDKKPRSLCHEHYAVERWRGFKKIEPKHEEAYMRDVLPTDYSRNIELVKKQDPNITDQAANHRAIVWAEFNRGRIKYALENTKLWEDNYYANA